MRAHIASTTTKRKKKYVKFAADGEQEGDSKPFKMYLATTLLSPETQTEYGNGKRKKKRIKSTAIVCVYNLPALRAPHSLSKTNNMF